MFEPDMKVDDAVTAKISTNYWCPFRLMKVLIGSMLTLEYLCGMSLSLIINDDKTDAIKIVSQIIIGAIMTCGILALPILMFIYGCIESLAFEEVEEADSKNQRRSLSF